MKKSTIALCMALAACVCLAEDAPTPAARPAVPRRPGAPMQRARSGFAPRNGFVRSFGKLADGTEVKIYRLRGMGGLILDVSDYGGRVVRCYAPDKFGNLADVTLGWNTPGEYEKLGFSMGTLIGRYGNRIADGKFTLDGKEYQLPLNETTNNEKTQRHCNLHSGPEGWDKKVWKARPLRQGFVQGLELTYVSKDGEMGYPGTVTCKVTYKVLPNNTWTVDYEATTDKTTVINPTHHSYWNLAGEASGNVLSQELEICADEYSEITDGLIPVRNAPVKGTVFDFTAMRRIDALKPRMDADEKLAPTTHWYDHNFMLRGAVGEMKRACTMRDGVSGRELQVWTTEPAMQMYGAQNMDGTLPAKRAGAMYPQYAGMALETQHCPDSPNHPEFPSTVLRPGETFRSRTEYRFSAR